MLISFPYTNLMQFKQRPAIIISDSEYNDKNDDVICCAITSNPKEYKYSIDINNLDLETGYLKYKSRIKVNKLMSLEKSRIIKSLCKLNINKSKEVVKNLNQFIKIEE